MNDIDVMNEVRRGYAEERITIPLEAVVRRGRDIRRRRWLSRLAATAAVIVIGVAVAVATVVPGSGTHASLAAWTVTRKPTGLVVVTVRELKDPAKLQRTLRADGVPTIVRFNGYEPPACLYDPTGMPNALKKVLPMPPSAENGTATLAINPSAIQSGTALWITVSPQPVVQQSSSGGGHGTLIIGPQVTQVYATSTGHCPANAMSGT